MTEQIGTHGLSCVTDDDYAAYALLMQCNAEATDAALTQDSAAFDEYLDRPWVQVVNTSTVTIDDDTGSGSVGPFGLIGRLMGTDGGGSGSPDVTSFNISLSPYPPGVFLIGSSINWTLAAATADSYRQLMVYGVRNDGGVILSNVTFTDLSRMRDYQGDGGNSGALNVVGLLDTRNSDVVIVEAFFSHANVAGDLTVTAGNWRVWATYLGSGLSI